MKRTFVLHETQRRALISKMAQERIIKWPRLKSMRMKLTRVSVDEIDSFDRHGGPHRQMKTMSFPYYDLRQRLNWFKKAKKADHIVSLSGCPAPVCCLWSEVWAQSGTWDWGLSSDLDALKRLTDPHVGEFGKTLENWPLAWWYMPGLTKDAVVLGISQGVHVRRFCFSPKHCAFQAHLESWSRRTDLFDCCWRWRGYRRTKSKLTLIQKNLKPFVCYDYREKWMPKLFAFLDSLTN